MKSLFRLLLPLILLIPTKSTFGQIVSSTTSIETQIQILERKQDSLRFVKFVMEVESALFAINSQYVNNGIGSYETVKSLHSLVAELERTLGNYRWNKNASGVTRAEALRPNMSNPSNTGILTFEAVFEDKYPIIPSTEIPLTSDKDGIGEIGEIGYGDGKALNSKGRLQSLGNLETMGETGYMELTFVYNRKVKKFESINQGPTSFSGQKEREAFEKAKKALEATEFVFASDDPLKVKGTFVARWKYKS